MDLYLQQWIFENYQHRHPHPKKKIIGKIKQSAWDNSKKLSYNNEVIDISQDRFNKIVIVEEEDRAEWQTRTDALKSGSYAMNLFSGTGSSKIIPSSEILWKAPILTLDAVLVDNGEAVPQYAILGKTNVPPDVNSWPQQMPENTNAWLQTIPEDKSGWPEPVPENSNAWSETIPEDNNSWGGKVARDSNGWGEAAPQNYDSWGQTSPKENDAWGIWEGTVSKEANSWTPMIESSNTWEKNKSKGKSVWRDPAVEDESKKLLVLNTNTPWAAFLCGLQGSGKSHSLSVLLENCLLPHSAIGILRRSMPAIIFHYSPLDFDPETSGCEAAYLSEPSLDQMQSQDVDISSARSVTVLVSKSNAMRLRRTYSRFPRVKVVPLLLQSRQLTVTSILKLMAGPDDSPLYMQIVRKILREMSESDIDFDYDTFRSRLSGEKLTKMQLKPLRQRLELLESFLGASSETDYFNAGEGDVVIVDMSCPFVDKDTACILFKICLDVFLVSSKSKGKVVALDEAHKFLSDSTSSKFFTDTLIHNIRLQRHLGIRTIISTQDPVCPPEMIELSSIVLLHRITSMTWVKRLQRVITLEDSDGNPRNEKDLLKMLAGLETGQAILSCPLLVSNEAKGAFGKLALTRLNLGYRHVQIRRRLTLDGGVTVTAI